ANQQSRDMGAVGDPTLNEPVDHPQQAEQQPYQHQGQDARWQLREGMGRQPVTDPQVAEQAVDDAGKAAEQAIRMPEILTYIGAHRRRHKQHQEEGVPSQSLDAAPELPEPQRVEADVKQAEMQKGGS